MTYKKNTILIILFLTFILNLIANIPDNKKNIKKDYNNAKKFIIKKDWAKAVKLLEKIIKEPTENKLKDNALYWIAYSLKKNAGNIEDREKQVETLKNAIEKLNSLVEIFPSSNWIEDGKMLRIEIAEDLIKRGLDGYKKIIFRSSEQNSKENIKIYALDALLNMNDKKAFPLLKKMINSNASLKLKKKAIFILSQKSDKRILPFLTKITLSDNPYELKKEAIFWIGQINGKEGLKNLLDIYKKSKNIDIKQKTIFAIAQTGEPGILELIKIYKLEKNIQIKKKILFWIGQSNSKTAKDFLTKILFD